MFTFFTDKAPVVGKSLFSAANAGPIAGVAIGILVFLILVVLLVVMLLRRRNSAQPKKVARAPSRVTGAISKMEFGMEKITIMNEIGVGRLGRVCEASAVDLPNHTSEPTKVTIRFLAQTADKREEREFSMIAGQLLEMRSPHIIEFYASSLSMWPHFLVLEHAENGDLKAYLKLCQSSNTPLPLGNMLSLVNDFLQGFSHIQQLNIVHGDLATRNMILTSQFKGKIGDFGMLCRLVFSSTDVLLAGLGPVTYPNDYFLVQPGVASSAIPLRWLSPEAYVEQIRDLWTDSWAAGVTIWGLSE